VVAAEAFTATIRIADASKSIILFMLFASFISASVV
jgi:hypothetical protein